MFWRGVWGYLPANIIQGLVGFGAILVFTRLLSPDDFGRYALAISITTLVHVGAFSWLEASMAALSNPSRANTASPVGCSISPEPSGRGESNFSYIVTSCPLLFKKAAAAKTKKEDRKRK